MQEKEIPLGVLHGRHILDVKEKGRRGEKEEY